LWLKLPIAPRWIVLIFGAIGLGLLPWTAWLSTSLKPHHSTDNWDLAWSGFDSALAALFMLTAYAAWHRRPWLPASAAATGALLIADAWFDVTLESRTNDFKVALIEAVAAELPLAAICLWIGFTTEVRAEPTPP
jgi:predicted branched-subunit amino acid permease